MDQAARTLADVEEEIRKLQEERVALLQEKNALPLTRWAEHSEFAEEHGGRPIWYRDGILLPDGAVNKGTLRFPPPRDPLANLLARVRYRLAFAERINADAYALRAVIQGFRTHGGMAVTFRWPESTYGCPGPATPQAAMARLKQVAEEHRAALADLGREVDGIQFPGSVLVATRNDAVRLLDEVLALEV